MVIREATDADKEEIIALYIKSQAVTGLPDPKFYSPAELGEKLYERTAIKRFVTEQDGKIVAHGLVEVANPDNLSEWRGYIKKSEGELMELGGAFVDPERSKKGLWTKLLIYRINYIKSLNAIPVTATWSTNNHVMRVFARLGGVEVGRKKVIGGSISLYIF